MLIFDSFPDQAAASSFAVAVRDTFVRKTIVCSSQEESDTHDPCPCALVPPIVLVERKWTPQTDQENQIIQFVQSFDGVFAGT